MLPSLGQRLFGVSIGSFGFFAAIGVAIGIVAAIRAGRREDIDRRRLVDLVLWVLVAAMVGAKLTSTLVEWRSYVEEPWTLVFFAGAARWLPRVLAPWEGGLVFYGGVLGGLCAAVVYLRRRRDLPFGRSLDVLAMGLALGHVWGKLGCFLVGCCYGKAGGGRIGVELSEGSRAFERHAVQGLLPDPFTTTYRLHPVQLYEAGVGLALAVALIVFFAPRRRRGGHLALAYLLLYSVTRFVLEFYRGDHERGFLGEPEAFVTFNRWIGVDGGSPTVLSVSQCIALLVTLGCGFAWLLALHRPHRPRKPSVTDRSGVRE